MAETPTQLHRKFLDEGGRSKLEIAEFAPVRKERLTMSKVLMLASVGGKLGDGERWELVSGKEYTVSAGLADQLILNGWATGELSRKYSNSEIETVRSRNQDISVPSNG